MKSFSRFIFSFLIVLTLVLMLILGKSLAVFGFNSDWTFMFFCLFLLSTVMTIKYQQLFGENNEKKVN